MFLPLSNLDVENDVILKGSATNGQRLCRLLTNKVATFRDASLLSIIAPSKIIEILYYIRNETSRPSYNKLRLVD